MKPDRRVLYAVLLAVVSGLTACDRTDRVGDLTAPTAPQFAKNARAVKILRTTNPLTQDVTYESKKPIDFKGGSLQFANHMLEVPRNAVSGPTFFSATIRAGAEIRIDLRAWAPNGTAVSRFDRAPVKLTVSLTGVADNLDAIRRVVVVYHNPNGSLETMPTSVDVRNNTVTATLNHFSDYSPALD